MRVRLLLLFALTSCRADDVASSPPPASPAAPTPFSAPTPTTPSPSTPPPPECSASAECASGLACCSAKCALLSDADQDCGACGPTCGTRAFCAGSSCHALQLTSLCTSERYAVIVDEDPEDAAAAATVAQALESGCGRAIAVTTASQSDAAILDPANGAPIAAAGRTLVFTGGSFIQRGLAYLEQNGHTEVVGLSSDGRYTLRTRSNGRILLQTSEAAIDQRHDYFVVEIARDPTTSTLAILLWGVRGQGTLAAAAYFTTHVLPGRAQLQRTWYVYEWTDTNQNGVPDSGDQYAVVQSG